MPAINNQGVLLSGLDGSNPLGFLAAVGTLRILSDVLSHSPRLGWRSMQGSWRPLLAGCGNDEQQICHDLLQGLTSAPAGIFDIGKESSKFPFDREQFVKTLKTQQGKARPSSRRDVDFLAAFGTELNPDRKKPEFQETRLRMVRTGDSSGHGMLFYASANRKALDYDHVERTLFKAWRYTDDGYSLRWDPIEDQPYALQWRDPSKSKSANGLAMVLAANCLAVESLRCFPTVALGRRTHTTGFHRREDGEVDFVWPIWTPMADVETLQCLVALGELYESPLPRSALRTRGIEDVYCARQVRPNKYYSNFAPSQPLL